MIEHSSPKLKRRLSQQNQILDSASRCFVDHGFHGASMARIAATAHLSVGQIYRHFGSKEEIISAIVARQLETLAQRLFPPGSTDVNDAREMLSNAAKQAAENLFDSSVAGLLIEIRAEAARNPAIAQILGEAEKVLFKHFRSLVCQASSDTLSGVELERRTRFLAIVVDGLIFRAPFDNKVSKNLARELIELVLRKGLLDT